ncbi:hypothetical protein L210DRAFT_720576 [Boletus edulis BED1]|uniref:Uncharacterized protein n=1 Tax=Boletus edulis BED1 TaxID=1328754 RepID=A0AAD4BCB1_BOLED|nr:hypothetical protein L210DRAFT_720576 [Boletus edulis BED1]
MLAYPSPDLTLWQTGSRLLGPRHPLAKIPPNSLPLRQDAEEFAHCSDGIPIRQEGGHQERSTGSAALFAMYRLKAYISQKGESMDSWCNHRMR